MTSRGGGAQSRVSAACIACRSRRTKCTTNPGETSCIYCRSKGQECIYEDSGERRPKSKGYINSLLENIKVLEQRLREAGMQPPQFSHKTSRTFATHLHPQHGASPSKDPTSQLVSNDNQLITQPTSPARNVRRSSLPETSVRGSPASPDRALEIVQQSSDDSMNNSNVLVSSTDHNPLKQLNDFKPQQQSAKRTATVWSQIFGSNRLIYHKNTRRVTYLSASTSYKCLLRDHSAVELTQLDKHCYRTLADVPADMDHYLMDLFWNKYNSILRVVDQNAFCKDQKSGGSASYSGFLHLVCLAMAVRFADKNRTGIKQIMADDKHSVFHREAKFLLDRELDNPQGCTVIQAVLILSDLESACGRDDLAAMHITTSCHLAFDFGLNIDCSSLELPETEMTFRRSLLRSCIIYDQAWALYLGRPTNIKLADISSVCLTSNTGSSLSSSPSGLQHAATNESASSHEDLHGQILDALLELSTLSAEIQALSQPILSPGAFGEESRLPDIAMLNTKLKAWAANLPPRLTWTAENIKDASRVFFLMHQQFQVSQLVLYGPYGRYEDAVGMEAPQSPLPSAKPNNTGWWRDMARSITMNAALKIVQGFSKYRQNFGTCQTSIFSLQQGGTAFLALMCNVKVSKELTRRNLCLQHLQMLMEQLREMSQIWVTAQTMCSVACQEMEQLEIDFSDLLTPPQTPGSVARPSAATLIELTDSGSTVESEPAAKRRRLFAYQEDTTANSASIPNSEFTRNAGLPVMTPSGRNHDVGYSPPSPLSLDLFEGQPPLTFPGDSFGSLVDMPSPLLDFSMAPTSWPADLSPTSAMFDFRAYDLISNSFFDSFLPESRDLDGSDMRSRNLPGVT